MVAENENNNSKLIISVHGGHVEHSLNFNSILVFQIFCSWENLNHKSSSVTAFKYDLKLNNNKITIKISYFAHLTQKFTHIVFMTT